MPLFGVAFYLIATRLVWRTLQPSALLGVSPSAALAGWAGIGLAASVVLTGLEAFVIHAFCTWCVGQAIASAVLALSAFVISRDRLRTTEELRESGRERKRRQRTMQDQRSRLRSVTLSGGGVVATGVLTLLIAGAVSAGPPTVMPSASVSALAPADAPRLGTGPVPVVEFADFECPACAAVSPILDRLAAEGSIMLVYRHFPLPQHANAISAARAAEAASSLGKFWPMHDLLFQTQQQWQSLSAAQADAYFADLAGRIGLSRSSWQAAHTSSASLSRVQTDAADAAALRLPGTPSIFINGRRYNGSLSESALRAAMSPP
jgi:protein-disulfide isomerase